jgi:diguanylate cyclase (GGDEF)-like protein
MTDVPSPSTAHQGLVAEVLERGHARLRFPPALEAQFQADTLEPRRKLLLMCGLIGIVSICVGSANLAQLMPDIVGVAYRNVSWILAISAFAVSLFWIVPVHRRRHWQAELWTAIPLLSVNAGLIYGCMISHADTTYTHSAALVSTVMYACIAARLRFVWSLGCALISFVAFITLARGHTPRQDLIITATTNLMAVSYVFALVANYAFEHGERRTWLLRKLAAEQRQALTETSQRLHHLSTQDPLTQLYNRRQFDSDLARLWSQAQLTGEAVSLVAMDVDFFKRYNDTYGHPAGDACLVQVGQALSKVAQDHGGIAARLGGEEFGLLLPARALDDALRVGAALCDEVRLARIEHRASSVCGHVTVSVGVAQLWPAQGASSHTLEALADQALYQAKGTGRDRVCAINSGQPGEALASSESRASAPPFESVDAEPVPAAEAAYVQILAGRFRRLRFPPAQEALWHQHNAVARTRQLEVMAVVGVMMNFIYALVSREMFPDIEQDAQYWQFGLSAAMLLMTAMSHLRKVSVWWREAAFSLSASILAVVSAWVLSQSQQTIALAFSVCLVLIPMFAGVGARQPFWFTCVPSLITCVAVSWLLKPVGTEQLLVYADSLLAIATNTMFTLILAYTLEHGSRKAWLLTQIEQIQGEALQKATRNLHDLSMLDPLTGICNRRQFEEDFQRIWADSLRDGKPLSMLMIDVDFFKRYNDSHGHTMGDSCLKQLASTIHQMALTCKGLTARLGGEEFGVLLPGAPAEQARQLGEHICAAVRQRGIEHRQSEVPGQHAVTVSIGVASLVPGHDTDPRLLLAMADGALYQAKNRGRNRVAVGDQPEALQPRVTQAQRTSAEGLGV